MSIATYTELQTAVRNWLNRTKSTDVTYGRVPEFIALAESRINRLLRLRNQEQLSTASYSTTDTTRRIALPSGFLEMLTLSIKPAADAAEKYEPLIYKAPERLIDRTQAGTGQPKYYTLRDELEFDRLADASYTLRMYYFKRWDIATDATNWLLTNHPGVYLIGALLQAEPYVKNDERMPLWKALFEEEITELNRLDDRSRNHVEMDLDPMVDTLSQYNILTDR